MVNINREDRMSPTVATVGLLTITHARTTRNETREAKKGRAFATFYKSNMHSEKGDG